MDNSDNDEKLTRLVIAENGTCIDYRIGNDIKLKTDIQLWGSFIQAIHSFFLDLTGEAVLEIKSPTYTATLKTGEKKGTIIFSLAKHSMEMEVRDTI